MPSTRNDYDLVSHLPIRSLSASTLHSYDLPFSFARPRGMSMHATTPTLQTPKLTSIIALICHYIYLSSHAPNDFSRQRVSQSVVVSLFFLYIYLPRSVSRLRSIIEPSLFFALTCTRRYGSEIPFWHSFSHKLYYISSYSLGSRS